MTVYSNIKYFLCLYL